MRIAFYKNDKLILNVSDVSRVSEGTPYAFLGDDTFYTLNSKPKYELYYYTIVDGAIVEKSQEDKELCYPVVLQELKAFKLAQIDTRTDAIISQGFTYADKQFSLSLEAQSNWTGMMVASDFLTFPYEITAQNADNVGGVKYSLADKAELVTFYLTGIGYVSYVIGAGRALKLLVNEAATPDAVLAVEDAR